MEGNYLTSGDLALFSEAKSHRAYGYDGCYGDYGHRRGAYGAATTGIGLAAGLGGAALLGVARAAFGACRRIGRVGDESSQVSQMHNVLGNPRGSDLFGLRRDCRRRAFFTYGLSVLLGGIPAHRGAKVI